MAACIWISFALLFSTIICLIFAYHKISVWKERLRKKDRLIGIMFTNLPKLLPVENDLDFYASVRPEYNSDYLNIDITCDNEMFITNVYRYLHSLQIRGYKVAVNNKSRWKKKSY